MECRGCGRALDEDARFCKHCGRPVEGRGDAPATIVPGLARERKVATLLFADVAGFTALSEAHDPELVSQLVTGTFERLAEVVRRHEGTIEKFAGDAMLAVFGVPAAHEDDPERAVRAALEMQAAMGTVGADADDGPELALRIGVETGEVLVDHARLATERDLFVTGDAVNTAARLEASAAPGTAVVGPGTYRATHHLVDYEALPALTLKGKAAPVVAWQALAMHPDRGSGRVSPGPEAPMVGREAELARLLAAVGSAVETGRPQLVTVVGSAGVGKSRLAQELERSLAGTPHRPRWRTGRCLAYADRSFGAIAEVMRADAGLADDPGSAQEALRVRLDELGLATDEEVGDALAIVLGLDARRRPKDEQFAGWRRYLEAVAQEAPLVLAVEDLHWADDELLTFLTVLARWGEGPMVVLCLARHELLERHPGWGAGLPQAETLTLEPLTTDDSGALLDGLLAGGLPAALRERIVERAEGNPLFAEESVRMLVDEGSLRHTDRGWELAKSLEDIEMPGSVQAVIAARLDSLPQEEKRTAQDAAVIGRIFWDRLVAHLAEDDAERTNERIGGLNVKELVLPRLTSSLADAAEYSFRHVLIRDVAYDSLPKRERARLHEAVATWAEGHLAERIGEFAELIASHLVAAVGYAKELGAGRSSELRGTRELAYAASLRAARQAASADLFPRACRWMWTAIDLGRALDLGPREIAELADEDATWHGNSAWEGYHAESLVPIIDALEASPNLTDEDEQLLARLRCALIELLEQPADFENAEAILRAGLDRLEGGDPSPGRARLYRELGWVMGRAGRHEEAMALLERAIAEARACSDDWTLRWALMAMATSVCFVKGLADGLELIEESYRLALEANDQGLIYRYRNNMPYIRGQLGEPLEASVTVYEEGLARARREAEGGSDDWFAFNLAITYMYMGRLDDALTHIDEAISTARAIAGESDDLLIADRAIIHRLRGEIAAAEEDEAELERRAHEPAVQVAYVWLLVRAWAEWSRDPAAALAELATHLERDERYGDPGAVPYRIAQMALRLGDLDLVRRAVEQHRRTRRFGDQVLPALYGRVDGLITDDDGATLEAAAAALEERGYILHAQEAWADAALLAARAGRASVAQERAVAIAERTGVHHILGPLPETRWISPQPG